MVTESLRDEYKRLESVINDLKGNIDLQNQELHKYTYDISLAKVLELEYIEEIESQQKAKSSIKQDLQKEIKRVQDGLSNLQINHQHEMVHQAKAIETIKSQIKERKRALALKEKVFLKNDDVNRETKKNSELKREVDLATVELEKVQENYEDLKLQNQELNATQQLFMEKLKDLKSSLRVKAEELARIQDLMQDLQKSAFDKKLKLDSLKSKPLDPTKKGNSMFGEVEDSCVKLLNNLQQMKNFHSSIEEELKEDFEKMKILIQDNVKIRKSLEKPNDHVNEYQVELDKFLSSVPFLEAKTEEYKSEILKECEFVAEHPTNFNIQYVNHKIKSLWKKVIDTGDELNKSSQEVVMTFKTLADLNKKLRYKKRDNFLLNCKVDELDFVLLQLQRNGDFDEIKGTFQDNSFVTEVIDGSKTEKKSLLRENNIFSNTLSNPFFNGY